MQLKVHALEPLELVQAAVRDGQLRAQQLRVRLALVHKVPDLRNTNVLQLDALVVHRVVD